MNARTAKRAHKALTAAEAVAAAGAALLVGLAVVALVGLGAGWPWQAVVLAVAYPAGHLAHIGRKAPTITTALRRADGFVRRRINDHTDPRTDPGSRRS